MLFTDEHKEIRRTITNFVVNEINPYVDEWEQEGCSGLIKPDTNKGGKIATREVFNGKTTKIIFNRIQA